MQHNDTDMDGEQKRKQNERKFQEIFDEDGRLIEIHEKYPENKGHIRVKGGGR